MTALVSRGVAWRGCSIYNLRKMREVGVLMEHTGVSACATAAASSPRTVTLAREQM